MKKMKSAILYQGPSVIDGKPIVAIAMLSRTNPKVGFAVQTYILVDGITPLEASKNGADFSICGDCKFRGETNTDHKTQASKKS